jgi:hypothetical protein
MADIFLNGESKSMATMPMLKIWTPPPDMYNMNACMGSDLTGEMAKSHARFCFSASWESRAAVVVVVVAAEEDLLGALACKQIENKHRAAHQFDLPCWGPTNGSIRTFEICEKPGGEGSLFHLHTG